jgi:signal transduction histidine kinase/ligand-binding sensor domain-containing protein
MAQTRDRYLWFGTFSGLVQFDGVRFKGFNTTNTAAFRNNTVWSLHVSRSGALWIGTNGGGLIRYENGRFVCFTTEHGLPANTIRALSEDRNGTLWVGTTKGLCSLATASSAAHSSNASKPSTVMAPPSQHHALHFEAVHLPTPNGLQPSINVLFGDTSQISQVSSLSSSPPTAQRTNAAISTTTTSKTFNVWVGTEGGGVYHLMNGGLTRISVANGLPADNVNEIYQDASHLFWIGTSKGYCTIANADAHGSLLTSQANPHSLVQADYSISPTQLGDCVVRRIRQDRDGNVWIATSSGLFRSTNGILSGFPASNELAKANLNTLLEDNEGNLWIGSYNSLGLICLRNGLFLPVGVPEGLATDVIYSIAEQPRQNTSATTFWFGGYGGITRYEQTATQPRATRYFLGENSKPQAAANLVRALLFRRDGSLWAATYGAGVFRFDGRQFVSVVSTKNGLSNDIVRCLFEDVRGALWIGTRNGLAKYKDGICTLYSTANGLPHNSIMSLFEDSKHRLWVATDGGGVACVSGGETKNISIYSTRNGLASDVVFSFYEDATGALWITSNGGITRLKNGRMASIRGTDGLPNENVYHLASNGNGTFWCGGTIGIFSMQEATLNATMDAKERGEHTRPVECTLFGKADGMRAVDCTVPAELCRTSQGIWFPTLKGALYLDKQPRPAAASAPLYVQSLQYDGQTITLDTASGQEWSIPAGARQFTIEYTALCFAHTERIRFRYRLDGVDNDWLEAGQRRTAYYTNLPPATYTFHVIACNADGVWEAKDGKDAKGVMLRFTVQPHIWQTLWFYALCGLGVMATGWGITRYQVSRVRRRNELLKRLVDEQTMQLTAANRELESVNQEIQRQNEVLSEQAAEIEVISTGLQEKNAQLGKANLMLHEQNLTLEELDNEKNEFLGIVAHDLKNPLAQITMSASLLQRYLDNMTQEQVAERLQGIQMTAQRMGDIIAKLLDINAIESGKLLIHPTPCHLNHFVESFVQQYAERATAKNIRLHFMAGPEQPIALADKHILTEILDNLISNAVKYSPQGKSVFVRCWSENTVRASDAANRTPNGTANGTANDTTDTADKQTIRISIRDEGPGLSEADQQKLFGKFARLSAQPTGGEHSTGLGLSIVKKLVEAMNGRVWCESVLGAGATFIVELPAAPDAIA